MESKKFSVGVMIGALTFTFVMVNLWFWNIVPEETMRAFDSDKQHVYMIIAIAIGSLFGGGFLYTAIFDRPKK